MDKTMNERLAWLAGIVDGEGYIGASYKIFTAKNRKGFKKKYTAVIFQVAIGNTQLSMIDEVEDILRTHNVVNHRRLTAAIREKGTKPFWTTAVSGGKEVSHFLALILPWLINKKERALQVLEVIAYRKRTWNPAKAATAISPADDVWLKGQLDSLRIREVSREVTYGA